MAEEDIINAITQLSQKTDEQVSDLGQKIEDINSKLDEPQLSVPPQIA
jgi:peptidoglycan hydrolase CwlO-like protein